MNTTPLVSVLIPVYNVEKYIERCARSVFEQTYENIEYIFVDDCTPDNSFTILMNVLEDYPQRASHVRIVKHEQNEGIAVGRNTAISNATGDFIFFIDSDDYLEADAITALVEMQKQTNADIVTGQKLINDDGIDTRFVEPIYKDKDEMLMSILSNVWHHEITDRLIKRSLFTDNNIRALPHVNICEDWQLSAKVVYYADKCVTLNRPTYHYMYNPCSLVHSNNDWIKEKNAYNWEFLSLDNLVSFFKGTKYEGTINSLFARRLSDMIDIGVKNHDKGFFEKCKSRMLSIPSKYRQCISKKKQFCINSGYGVTSLFLFLHHLRQMLK